MEQRSLLERERGRMRERKIHRERDIEKDREIDGYRRKNLIENLV